MGWRLLLRRVAHDRATKAVFAGCLAYAICGGAIWQLLDFSDWPSNIVLDVLMTLVFVLFIAEVIINSIGEPEYFGSFFFGMDVLGTLSMVFEVSYLLSPAGKMNQNATSVDPVLMRTARVAKTAARAGRFLKITKCLEIIVRRSRRRANAADVSVTARRLQTKLMTTLSTKLALLTLLLVMMMPLARIGQYPEADLSMKAWGRKLEEAYFQAYRALERDPARSESDIFAKVVAEMEAFYTPVAYFPYALEGYPEHVEVGGRSARILGAGSFPRQAEQTPVRVQNIVKQVVATCLATREGCSGPDKAALYFNFVSSARAEALTEMAMSAFIILVMAFLTSDLALTIDRLVVAPLERMLGTLRSVTAKISALVGNDGEEPGGRKDIQQVEYVSGEPEDEMFLLERSFEKLSMISKIVLQDKVVDDLTMDLMGSESRGVIVDMMGMRRKDRQKTRSNLPEAVRDRFSASVAGMDPDAILALDSWNTHVLDSGSEAQQSMVMHIFFDSELGACTASRFTSPGKFRVFARTAMAEYTDLPYHNVQHAVDVLHCVFRLLSVTSSKLWVDDAEIYALMVAALCHDLGHLGRTNPFLVEIGHDLALLYNDASPMENMHAARLFGITSDQRTDVFSELAADDFKAARKVCVQAILRTDNAYHFDMVKDLTRAYEVSKELCDRQAASELDGALVEPYVEDVLKKDSMLYFELFLHFADVSNPLKAFPTCRVWAFRVLEELFDQGDEEKRLGIPVGMLHDREKVNKPGSQHGFINFLVSPLVFATVRIFPPLLPLAQEMATNLRQWRDIWVEEAGPDSEAIVKRDADVAKVNATVAGLAQRLGN
mmetsp:Transcript_56820/g.173008  ORF Transcript_56820/g.173008 Transcript_56820/m.173008 type:complete len:834 (-) Transcript_56820:172-2673(-)